MTTILKYTYSNIQSYHTRARFFAIFVYFYTEWISISKPKCFLHFFLYEQQKILNVYMVFFGEEYFMFQWGLVHDSWSETELFVQITEQYESVWLHPFHIQTHIDCDGPRSFMNWTVFVLIVTFGSQNEM